VPSSPIERWLAARSAAALRLAWAELAPRRRDLAQRDRRLTLHGAAQLAGAVLGERADWLVAPSPGAPSFEVDRIVGDCFFDDAWDTRQRCNETWRLVERRAGDRGVQLATISCGSADGRPEGGSATVVRIFAPDRAASLVIETAKVSTIGELELAPLDLLRFSQAFALASVRDPIDALRGLVALLATELDARFDTSAIWPRLEPPAAGLERFGDADRSLAIRHDAGTYPRTTAEVHGLPWGHQLAVVLQGSQGHAYGQLPNTDIDHVLARLAATTELR
jgi:hypothetical protein